MSSRYVVSVLLLTVATMASSAPACHVGEVAHFVCKFQDKIATLCASSEKDTGRKLFQYRMAKRGHIEMQYPNTPQAPDGHFLRSSLLLAHGGEVRLSFAVAEYKYILYEEWDTRSPSSAGIYVLRDKRLLRQYQCDEYSESTGLLESLPKGSLQEEKFFELH